VLLGEQRRFTGHEFDAGTGLNYMNARYQDPVRGQFLNEDPAVVGLNPATALVGNMNTATVDAFLNSVNHTSAAYLDDPQALNLYTMDEITPSGILIRVANVLRMDVLSN